MPNLRPVGKASAIAAVLSIVMSAALPATAAAPNVSAILARIMSAHKAVKAMSCLVTLDEQEGSHHETNKVIFEFRKPDFARMTVVGSNGLQMRAVSNGKQLMVYSVADKQYLSKPLTAGHRGAMAIASVSQSMILKAYMRPDALSDLIGDPASEACLAGTSTIDGVPVDIVDTVLDSSPTHNVKAAFGFSRKDHLLRSLAITIVTNKDGVISHDRIDEIVKSVTLTPRFIAADFDVTPPHGASEFSDADQEPALYDPRVKPGAVPFPIDATDIAGKRVSLGEYRGKVLLIDFWATWCGPCVAEIPNVLDVYKQFHGRGLEVVGFSQDQDEGALKGFLAERGIPWRQVFCGGPGEGKVPESYGIQAIPFMVLIGRNGKIAAVNLRGPELGEAVQAALAK